MLAGFARSVVTYGLIGGVSKALAILLLPVFTRAFEPSELGIVDLVATAMMFLTIVSMLQLEASMGRFFYEAEDDSVRRTELSTAYWTIAICSIAFACVLIILGGYVSRSLELGISANLILIMGCLLPVANLFAFFVAILRYLDNPILFALANLLQIVVTVVVTIWLVLFENAGVEGVFIGQFVGYTSAVICSLLYSFKRRLIAFTFDKEILAKHLRFSIPLVPGMVCIWANNSVNRYAMLVYLSLTEIGLFTVALRIASILRLVEDAIKMAWGPFLYRSLKLDNHRELFATVLLVTTLLVFMLVSSLILVGQELFLIFATARYEGAIQPMLILFLALGVNVLLQLVLIGPAITKKTHYNSALQLVGLFVNAGLLFLLVPRFGVIGVAMSLLMANLFIFAAAWALSESLYPVGFKVLPFLGCLAVGLLVLSYVVFVDPEPLIRWLLCIMISLGFCYVGWQFSRKLQSML